MSNDNSEPTMLNGTANGVYSKAPQTNGEYSNGLRDGKLADTTNGAGLQDRTEGAAMDTESENNVMPIAIVGMACRLPGGVRSAEDLWEMCSRARSGWSEMPPDRFSHASFHHPNPGKLGTYNAEGGHFLEDDIALFDAPFFNITVQEAIALDPQQRLMLECAYEALENGGIPKQSIVGRNVGVFVGGSFAEYELHCLRDTATTPMYESTGCAASLLSNRVSYHFDLRGPSVTLDTACSSSLSALHLACQSLRAGEISQAIVGGSHLNILPDYFITMSNSRLFSPEGKCFSFDHRATSGFGRGEGAGCIVLKPLDDALKAGDHIRAVILNSGMNQDGKTNGITVPSATAQEQLIRSVYTSAGLDMTKTGYVEAHGTGTKVGDPIEATALHAVFGQGLTCQRPLLVGSIKSNIGHLEGASGIVSIIKSAMILEKGFVLPNLNFQKPNQNIPLAEWKMKVPTSQIPWPSSKRYASVNNFSFGGSNAHAVLEKAPRPSRNGAANGGLTLKHSTRHLYILSANDKKSVETQMINLSIYLEERPEAFELSLMSKLAYTLCQRRSLFQWRVAVPATSGADLIAKLGNSDLLPRRATNAPNIGFVFTGQGAQWFGMGRELISIYPVFASVIQTADAHVRKFGAQWSLIDELSRDPETSLIEHAYISQPACTATQLALVDLLQSWGISPAAVVGHSSGEIAAAYAAGLLTVESCMKIAYYRGKLTTDLKTEAPKLKGAMLAIGSSQAEVEALMKSLSRGKVIVAAINSPKSVTVSGDEAAISELQEVAEEKGLFSRRLRVDMAYHSHHMNLIADRYLESLQGIIPTSNSSVVFYSTVKGKRLDHMALQPSYWVENLTSPVQFDKALSTMCSQSGEEVSKTGPPHLLIEIGPHSALEGPVRQILQSNSETRSKIDYMPSLIRHKDAVETTLQLAANLFMKGCPLDFAAVNFPRSNDTAKLLIDLPPYPWQHNERYWHDSRISRNHRFKKWPRHDLLGALVDDSNGLEPEWRNIVRLSDLPWLEDHQIQSNNVYPLAGYVTMAIEAAGQRALSRNIVFNGFNLREISISRSLLIYESVDVETKTTLRPWSEGTKKSSDTWDEFRVFSWTSESGWVEQCRGLIGIQKSKALNPVDGDRQVEDAANSTHERVAAISQACTTPVSSAEMYEMLDTAGVTYGTTFKGLENCRASAHHALADVRIIDTAASMPNNFETDYIIHPATIDTVIQILWPIMGAGRVGLKQLYVPSFVKNLSISCGPSRNPGGILQVFGSGIPSQSPSEPVEFDIFATQLDSPAKPCISFEGLRMTPVDVWAIDPSRNAATDLCYKLEWKPVDDLTKVDDKTQPLEMPKLTNGHSQGLFKLEVLVILEHREGISQIAHHSDLVAALENVDGVSLSLSSLVDAEPEGKICIFLTEMGRPLLANITHDDFDHIKRVITSAQGIIWAVRGAYRESNCPDANMIAGFARTIRSESGLRFVTVDFDHRTKLPPSGVAGLIADIFEKTFASKIPVNEMEYVETNGTLSVSRIVPDNQLTSSVRYNTGASAGNTHLQPFLQVTRPLKMIIERPGSLDTLRFIDDENSDAPLAANEIRIEVKAIGLNFKDVVIAMGHLPGGRLGQECSGIISAIGSRVSKLSVGDRVCAVVQGCFANFSRCIESSASRIPDSLSFEVAATLPIVYCTAYYALIDLGRLDPVDKILIHAAAGGVGQAAIGLAQAIGAEIFATVGSVAKKTFLMEKYSLQGDHIFYSRDTSFSTGIKRITKDYGVDVVLNSLAGDSLQASWECLAHFGRFIEIGKRDIMENSGLGMAAFAHNVSFASADLTLVAAERPQMMHRLLEDILNLYGKGDLKLVSPLATFSMSEVESAFRVLQGGKSMGKIVIVPKDGDQVKAPPPAIPITFLRSDATYIIIGGTGGIGRSLAEWMVEKGARHIALVSRGGTTDKVKRLTAKLEKLGANVTVHKCDVGNKNEVENLVATVSHNKALIRGLIHSAMVLHDVLFEKMSYEDYQSVVRPKVAGAWNLHSSLSNVKLDFFITLSSAAGIVGNKGQAAYSAANTFLNAFAQYRVSRGLSATTIDLAAVKDIGYLAENAEKAGLVAETIGDSTVNKIELEGLVAAAITGQMRTTCNNHCITGLAVSPNSPLPSWIFDAKFDHIRPSPIDQGDAISTPTISLKQALKNTPSQAEAQTIILTAVTSKVASILLIPVDEVDPKKSVAGYGLDSLVAIEIRNWITRELEANLQVLSGSLVALSSLVMRKSGLVDVTAFKTEMSDRVA